MLHDASLSGIPDINSENTCIAIKCATFAFYAVCFSVLTPCSYWSYDTLDAIVECGNAMFIETIKYTVPPNHQRMLIYMVPILILICFPVDIELLYLLRLVVN